MNTNKSSVALNVEAPYYYRLRTIMLILGFVLLVVYAIAMSHNPVVHDAFHDVRHAAGFPCH